MNQRFGKEEKLKSSKLIEKLFSEGKSLKAYPLKLVYVPVASIENRQIQAGFSVPKRLVKTAVDRNRTKRILREVYRKNKYLVSNDLKSSYAFMFIYINKQLSDYETLEKCMLKIMQLFNEKRRNNEKETT
ncbi:ribonuclease P protein component [Gramella sp. AN32]|uniref:Ribonuclease P protein component n=1 Tax=Christiangramia antarctica TaxID=2058158 RepID=A0ABW5X170_9FLAO|nr:ribonuclease P protein component [Gramella sp. AN32]MCM4154990.1 ribonuclease P protein component [Gramella sp. AN32]